MNRFLLPLVLVTSTTLAVSVQAQTATMGGASKPRPVPYANQLGPRSTDSTVAEAVARTQIERDGYSGVRDLVRTSGGGWQGVALGHNNKAVVVSLDGQGKLTEMR